MSSERRETMGERFERLYRAATDTGDLRWSSAERSTKLMHFLIYASPVESYVCKAEITKDNVQSYVELEQAIKLRYKIDDALVKERAANADSFWKTTGQHLEQLYRGLLGINGPLWSPEQRVERLKLFHVWTSSPRSISCKKISSNFTLDLVVHYAETEHDMKNWVGRVKTVFDETGDDWSYEEEDYGMDYERHWERYGVFTLWYGRWHLLGDFDDLRMQFATFLSWAHQQTTNAGRPVLRRNITMDLVGQYTTYERAIEERMKVKDGDRPHPEMAFLY